MKCLVLGSKGQIGAELVTALREKGHEAIEWDREEGDLCFYSGELHDAVKQADFVYFLAFDVGGSLYLKKYEKTKDFLDNNVMLMQTVFDLLAEEEKDFIFASSQMSNMSYSPYGVLKRLGEFYTNALGTGLNVKFWNVYGEEHDPDKTHVITDFVKSALESKRIDCRTDGTEVRQFLHANDCSECLIKMAERFGDFKRKEEGHSYDITSFEWSSIKQIARIIAEEIGDTTCSFSEAKDTVQRDAQNEPDDFILNFWQPKISLRKGIVDIIERMK